MKRKSKNLSTSLQTTLIYSGALLTFAVIIILLIYGLGKSETLSCIKLERKHISCQLEKYWYGLESTPIEKFKLTKADIVEIENGDDSTHEKLVLYDNNRPIYFYEDRQRIFFNDVQSDKERINKFITESEENQTLKISSYGFIRTAKASMYIIATLLSTFLIIILIIYIKYRFDSDSK